MPRPSLSGNTTSHGEQMLRQVSPGLMPRPSLSGRSYCAWCSGDSGVAGVDAPAFVERTWTDGAAVPKLANVSPGLMPRPSLSGDGERHDAVPIFGCRRG